MTDYQITYLPISRLKPNPGNARTHSKQQIQQIAESIEVFGFTNPVLIDKTQGIIAGHGRVEAAKLLKVKTVPTLCLEHLSPEQVKAYIIADNKLAENAGWDTDILAIELQGLLDMDLDFEITVTGFEAPEIDILIDGLNSQAAEEPEDDIPESEDGTAITQPGDLWQIGPHRLICGDATKVEAYEKLLEGDKAQMVFTDPPYNVPIDGHVCGLGKVKHREFAMGAGEMDEAAFTAFLEQTFSNLAAYSTEGALQFICMDWRHMTEIMAAGLQAYTELINLCVWAKTNGGMGSLYRSQHELVFVFKAGSGRHINNVELGKYGRNRTNVWTYPGISSFGKDRDTELSLHPTVKPVAMVADAILDCSHRGGIILDAFAGSGTTLVAAEKTGRQGYGIELDPHYCDVILKRLQTVTGCEPVHVETGKTLTEITEERASILEQSVRFSSSMSLAQEDANVG